MEYYRTPSGKRKKHNYNGRRNRQGQSKQSSPEESSNKKSYYKVDRVSIDEDTASYLQMVASLIEGRHVTRGEILSMLRKKWRQHSILKQRRILYNVKRLKKRPP